MRSPGTNSPLRISSRRRSSALVIWVRLARTDTSIRRVSGARRARRGADRRRPYEYGKTAYPGTAEVACSRIPPTAKRAFLAVLLVPVACNAGPNYHHPTSDAGAGLELWGEESRVSTNHSVP